MKSYWLDYTNHMLRVYYAHPDTLTDVEKVNVSTVQSILDNGVEKVDPAIMKECLSYVYNPPCEDFGSRVQQYCAVSGIPARDAYSILAKVARQLAKARGLI